MEKKKKERKREKKKKKRRNKKGSAKQRQERREREKERGGRGGGTRRGTRPDSPGKQGVPLRVPMGEESSQAWRTTRNKACNRNIVVDRCILIM